MRAYLFSVLLACIALPALSATNESELAEISNPISGRVSALIRSGWNLSARTIVPRIQQDKETAGSCSHFGLSDIARNFFLAPNSQPGDIVWGVGPAFLWLFATKFRDRHAKMGSGPDSNSPTATGGMRI